MTSVAKFNEGREFRGRCLLKKKRSSVLSLLSLSLLSDIQLSISFKQFSIFIRIRFILCSSSVEKDIYNWVLSAYRWNCMLWRRRISATGDVYNKYRIGPSTDFWGTPHFNSRVSEDFPLIETNWVRSNKYELSHLSALPQMPNLDWRLDLYS